MSISNRVRRNLLAIVAAWRKATGLSLQAASRKFYGNGSFFADLKSGKQKSLAVDTLDQVLDKMRADWPKDAIWPVTRAIFMDYKARE